MRKLFLGLLVVTVLVAGVASLAGCAPNDESGLVGKWAIASGEFIEWTSDGAVIEYAADGEEVTWSGTYEIERDGDKWVEVWQSDDDPDTNGRAVFEIEGDKVSFVDEATGNKFSYTRVK